MFNMSICQVLWCEHFHHGQFPHTNDISELVAEKNEQEHTITWQSQFCHRHDS